MADGTLVVDSAARTTNGDSGPLSGFADRRNLRCQLNVTAVAGTTPTLDVVLEDSLDGVNWNVLKTFTQAVAATRQVLDHTGPFADRIRFRWTVGGAAPSFTFDVRLHAD